MKTLVQSPDLRTQMGEAGYARVRKYFDWERKIDQIQELYHSSPSSPSTEQSFTVRPERP